MARDSEGYLTLTDCEIVWVEEADGLPENSVIIRTNLVLRAERDCAVQASSFAQGAPLFTPFAPDKLRDVDLKSFHVLRAGESAKYPVRYLCLPRSGKAWDLWPKPWGDKLPAKSLAK